MKLRILETLAWSPKIGKRFLAGGASTLPKVSYDVPDLGDTSELIAEAKGLAPSDPLLGSWVKRQARALSTTVSMLRSLGKPAFTRASLSLYGDPRLPFPGSKKTPLQLAERLERTAARLQARLGTLRPADLDAEDAARRIRDAVVDHLGESAPRVVVVEKLAARASAGTDRIRLRASARFTRLDVAQLVQHEALVHSLTGMNGRAQRRLPILGQSHAGTTRTQEGLAVFAELVGGVLDPARLRRIAQRVIATSMALEGADFIEVFRYFERKTDNPPEAFSSASRIFRGGRVEGGVPFTKDVAYFDGLCRVHTFVRAMVDTNRIDCLHLLFCGKLDIDDMPAIVELHRRGLCRSPKFLPPWVSDMRPLVSYLAVTDVINRASTAGLRDHYVAQLGNNE